MQLMILFALYFENLFYYMEHFLTNATLFLNSLFCSLGLLVRLCANVF